MRTLLFILAATQILASDISYHKVRLIDYNPAGAGTWLFRTNLPLINGTFAYDTFLSLMRNRSEQANITFPENNQTNLIDVSLLSVNSYWDLQAEFDFFTKYPERGHVI